MDSPQPQLTPEGNARGQKALNISIAFTSLAACAVVTRFCTRYFMVKRIGADDWMILTSMFFSFVFMGLFIGEKVNGLGNHQTDIPPHMMRKQMICFWLSVPMYNTSLFCTKASIVLQYLRVFPGKPMRYACYFALGFIGVYGTWAIVSGYVNCVPVPKFWDNTIEGGCLNMEALWLSNAIVHIVTDVCLLSMPMPVLSTLKLPWKQKVALMAIFALGGFVCITSGLRTQSLLVIAKSHDKTWDNVGAAYWSAIECNVGIFCASLPSLRPLFLRILPKFMQSTQGYSDMKDRSTSNRPSRRTGLTGNTQETVVECDMDHLKSNGKRHKHSTEEMGGIMVTKSFGNGMVSSDDRSSSERQLFGGP